MISDDQARAAREAMEQIVASRHKGQSYTFTGQVRQAGVTSPGQNGTTRVRQHPSRTPPTPVASALDDSMARTAAPAASASAQFSTQAPAQLPAPAAPPAGPARTVVSNLLAQYGWILFLGVAGATAWWVFRKRGR